MPTRGLVYAAALSLAVVLVGMTASPSAAGESKALAFFRALGPGWNLGNALDVRMKRSYVDVRTHETKWGNPPIDKKIFRTIYQAGFRTVRIPVSWTDKMNHNLVIDSGWMGRVQEVVDLALDSGLYVIINTHHDQWYTPYEYGQEHAERLLRAIWTQVSARFAEYDERLIFESMNEPRLLGSREEWYDAPAVIFDGINRLNQLFVEIIRSAPGNNRERYLLVPPYAASILPEPLRAFTMPDDARTAVSLHVYAPHFFSHVHSHETKTTWHRTNPKDTELLDAAFSTIREKFTERGIPVVVTEFGVINKDNQADRARWTAYVVDQAGRLSIPCIWWDNGVGDVRTPDNSFALFNRRTQTVMFPELVKVLTENCVLPPPPAYRVAVSTGP